MSYEVALFGRYGTDPAAAFLHRLREKHDLSKLVGCFVQHHEIQIVHPDRMLAARHG